jgi:hypothetical protein
MKKISFIVALIASMFAGNAMAQHLSASAVTFDKKTNPTEATLVINLSSEKLPAGVEFNVVLPSGFDFKRNKSGNITEKTLVASRGEALEIVEEDEDPVFKISFDPIDGGLNFTIVDYDGGMFNSKEGELVTLNLTCPSDQELCEVKGKLELVMLSDYDGTIAENEVQEFDVFVIDTDAINSINADGTEGDIYNTAGQRVSRTSKGLYIQNGKKVVKK